MIPGSSAESTREALGFSLPIVSELFLMSLLSMVNLALVGHLGAAALSAVGLSSQPVAISLMIFHSIGVGATALISRAVGSGKSVEAVNAAGQSLYLISLSGLILGILSYVFSTEIVLALGAQGDSLGPGSTYMRYMALGMLFQAIPSGITAVLRGAGDSRSPMLYNIATNAANVVLGFLLIHGLGPLPPLGLHGAGIATTVAKVLNSLLAIRALSRSGVLPGLRLKSLPPWDASMIRRIMKVGNSAAAEGLTMRLGFLIYSRLIADLGTVAFAAHQIILSATSFGSNIVLGMSAAASSLTGRSLGAGKPELAKTYNRILSNAGLAVSGFMALAFFFFGPYLARLFTPDAQVIQITGEVLKIAALITLPQNYLSILSGALRGAGDTKWPLYSALAGMIFARVGLSLLFVLAFGWGLQGAWAAALADQSIRCIFIVYRYKGEKWLRLQV